MNKKWIVIIILLIAISSLGVITALANSVYLPIVYNAEATQTPTPTNTPTPTATPLPKVYISGFHPSGNPRDDYVELRNSRSNTIDLTGWWLKTENQLGRYDFPIGFKLAGGAKVRVRSGIGNDTTSDLYIGLTDSLWTIPSNCAYLRDQNGTLLDKKCVQ